MTAQTSGTFRPAVAVAAGQRMLGDALCSLLTGQADVTLFVERCPNGSFDAAIVDTDDTQVDADVIVTLDDAPSSRGGAVVRRRGSTAAEILADLDAVIAFIADMGHEEAVRPR